MPYKIRKRKGDRPYKIVKILPNGSTKTVGSSVTLKDAKASIRARYMGSDEGR